MSKQNWVRWQHYFIGNINFLNKKSWPTTKAPTSTTQNLTIAMHETTTTMAGAMKALITNIEPMIYPAQPAAILFEQVEQAYQSQHGPLDRMSWQVSLEQSTTYNAQF